MEAVKDIFSLDLCTPGWGTRSVSRADLAFFEASTYKVKVIMYMTGENTLDFDVRYFPSGTKESERLTERFEKDETKHLIFPLEIQTIVPVPDLMAKLDKDTEQQKKALEKQIRNAINTAAREQAKASKKKRSKRGANGGAKGFLEDAVAEDDEGEQAVSKQAKFVFETLGLDIPKGKDAQIGILESLLEKEAKLDVLVQQAKDSVKRPDKVPLTKLIPEEDRTKATRAKLMQQALEQAKQHETASSEISQFGFHAGVLAEQQRSGADIPARSSKDLGDS